MTVVAIESITHRYVSAHPEGIDAEAVVDELTALVVGYLSGGGGPETYPDACPPLVWCTAH